MNDVSESPAARAAREQAAKTSPLLLLVPAIIAIVVAAVIALAFTRDDDAETVDASDPADTTGIEDDEESIAADDPAAAPAPTVDPASIPDIAASFRGVDLSGEELLARATTPNGLAPSPQALADQVTTWLLVQAVTDVLTERGDAVSDIDIAEAEASAESLGIQPGTIAYDAALELQALINALNDFAQDNATVGESSIELICSSHILLATEEEAFAAIDRIEAGDEFATVAMEVSTGPSGPAGGELGCVDTTTFVAEYVDGARENGVGVTEPVESQFGFHVIDVRYLGPLAEDVDPSMTPELFANLAEGEQRAAEAALFDEIVAQASEAVSVEHFIDPTIGIWIFPPGSVQAPPVVG